MRYITETRNLFPTSTAVGTLSGWDQSTTRQFEEDKWYIGISGNNYYAPNNIIDYELTGNYVYINGIGSGYGIGKAFKCEPNQTYTMTCKWIKNTTYFEIATGFYDENGNRLFSIGSGNLAVRHTFTTPANCKWFTVCFIAINKGSTYVYNIQLEKGSTATPYVPYGYLPMRRMKYKQNNVCQLLDKSKYPATQTTNGITFTNNEDGTITVNGTATSTAFFLLFKYSDSLMPEHKYLLFGSPNDASDNAYIQCYDDTNFEWLRDKGGGGIAIFPKQVVNPSGATHIRIRIASGYTANNLTFKPQLFDLTEMYGAGNEPTTVEQFRQDFPEEMYDYTPYCWASMKNIRYLDKTKNLFEWLGTSLHPDDYANAVLIEIVQNGIILQGNDSVISQPNHYNNGWFRPGAYYGTIANKVNLTAGDIVTISADYLLIDGPYNNTNIGIYLYGAANSTALVSVSKGKLKRVSATYPVTVTGEYYPVFTLNSSKVQITNIQIEKGSTATPYVPYGYLPLK